MSGLAAAPSGATGSHLGPLGSLLERFRRTSGVPAAASEDAQAELLPVFAALEAVEVEAAAVIADARREAEQRVAAAERAAERIRAGAAETASAERTRAEAEEHARADAEAAAVLAAGRAESAELLARGRERVRPLAQRIVAALFEVPS